MILQELDGTRSTHRKPTGSEGPHILPIIADSSVSVDQVRSDIDSPDGAHQDAVVNTRGSTREGVRVTDRQYYDPEGSYTSQIQKSIAPTKNFQASLGRTSWSTTEDFLGYIRYTNRPSAWTEAAFELLTKPPLPSRRESSIVCDSHEDVTTNPLAENDRAKTMVLMKVIPKGFAKVYGDTDMASKASNIEKIMDSALEELENIESVETDGDEETE
ncbi:hypothetical protein IFR05_016607 [Cadophora sp. M221]|nr:hypothetical protein IFR05_016607 [Cadophora sp. M221]